LLALGALCPLVAVQAQGGEKTAIKPGTVSPALTAAKAIRIRIRLDVVVPTDGAGLDTEDEIYYFLVQPQQGDTLRIKEVRPSGDPDVWEMGPGTMRKLDRWLFRGEVSALHPARLGLLVAEQDPSHVRVLETGNVPAQSNPFDPLLLPGMKEAASRVMDRDHQLLSFVQITSNGGKLRVTRRDQAVIPGDDDHVRVDLFYGTARYILHVYLDPDSGSAPSGWKFLGNEDDDCDPDKSLLVTGTAGEVPVPKGATRSVPIGQQQFTWHCGGTEESAVARPGTDQLEVKRHSSSDTVVWRCFKELTLTPDIP
jgi:hypothetical protein